LRGLDRVAEPAKLSKAIPTKSIVSGIIKGLVLFIVISCA
jgi:hypothetical protein